MAATPATLAEQEPTQPTKIPLYEASTQFKHWRFSVDELVRTRASMNEAAVDAIRATFEADEPGSSANIAFLNWEEEQLLVKLYMSKISQLCGHFRFPDEVEATAISYLKRFYLKNTVMDWHPKNVMLTTLFLAAKTTNNPISLEAFTTHIPKTSPSDVLDLEFLVAQSLEFEFAVWHAHRALWGIVLDIQSLPPAAAQTEDPPPSQLYDAALAHIRESRLTDAELIYTPSQIALAAASLVAPDLAARWSHSKLSASGSGTPPAALDATVEAIKSMIVNFGHPPNVNDVRDIDRRLKICKNPEKVVGSKAYLAKKAEEERKAEEKRNKKAVESQNAMANGDPFEELGHKKEALVDYDDDDDD
ncbi:hypothetical protein PC9H_003796 [Pleurotus ostreatus]|uniref:Cyclin-like domain-containing protein n=1 Tax=Pleurotus ostreatus TaxID=5322 RepID=A0A8H7A1M7_PLEOS|nr:uncharacterized protein PC9H_003796 [Pleurotus ostreatus]KAF7436962.1 hypothetical protein PC9H_003796 [Pleurotus ostreatus]KAJ8702784.1 hypothetical protein PTI98_001471 [Pleurotus ostreatus]